MSANACCVIYCYTYPETLFKDVPNKKIEKWIPSLYITKTI